jgi:hypothetical protein
MVVALGNISSLLGAFAFPLAIGAFSMARSALLRIQSLEKEIRELKMGMPKEK